MKCPSCGKKIDDNDTICSLCGAYVYHDEWDDSSKEKETKSKKEKSHETKKKKDKDKDVEEFQIKDSSGTHKDDFYYENEDYLEAYIGEDYKLTKKSPFNIWAFLFQWVYFLYRKLYITGILGLLVTWFAIYFLKDNLLYLGLYFVLNAILLGLVFNRYYVSIAKSRVEKIIKQEEDKDNDDKFTIAQVCREKGGVNVFWALVIYFIFMVAVIFSIVKIHVNKGYNPKFFEENSENKANCVTISRDAYKDVKSQDLGELKNAVCRVIKKKNKEYEIYFQTEKEGQMIYSYYYTEENYLKFKNNTIDIDSYRERSLEGTLSDEEQQFLLDLEDTQRNYLNSLNSAEEEDILIKEKKNKEEKLNYIIEKDEILR